MVVSGLIIYSCIASYYKNKISGVRLESTSVVTILVACGTTFTTVSYYAPDLSADNMLSAIAIEAQVNQDEEAFIDLSAASENVVAADDSDDDVVVSTQEEIEEESSQETQTVYTSGTYTANGEYTTDHGKLIESLDVTLLVKHDIVQDVFIIGYIIDNKSQRYHDRFEASIDNLVIVKELVEIDVDAVANASDTTDGFMMEIENIQKQALQ